MDGVITESQLSSSSPDKRKKTSEQHTFTRKIDFLEDRLNWFIDDYKHKRNLSRDAAGRFKLVNIFISGFVTLLLGIKSVPVFPASTENYFSLVALIFSTGVTAVSIWESFADYRWKWIRYRATLSTLYTIRDDFYYAKSGGVDLAPEVIDQFYDQLKRAVHETNEEWMSQRGTAIGGGSNTGAKK